MVKGDWKRGHAARGVNGYDPDKHGPPVELLPTPDEIDFGDIDPDPEPPSEPDARDWGPPPEPPLLEPDPQPAPPKSRKGRPPKPGHVTAGVKNDIRGQLALLIGTGAQMFQVIDPVCGGVAVAQTVPMAEAWTDVIAQSPKAVEFFTGSGGTAMLVFRAVWVSVPLVATVWNHHVAKTIQPQEEPQQERQYAA